MEWRLNDKQKRKYHAAQQLGLTQRLLACGWPGLTAKETGRIGAMLRRNKQE